jgi:hypothetical protein
MKKAAVFIVAALAVVIVAGSALAATGSIHRRHNHTTSSVNIFGSLGPIFTLGSGPGSVHLDLHGSGAGERLTVDAGSLVSQLGNRLTIAERVSGQTQDVTVDVDGARVVRNGTRAQLDDLRIGDQLLVLSNPVAPFVTARG